MPHSQHLRDFLRQRLLAKVSETPLKNATENLTDLKASEWSSEFETLMRNRLLMGRFRYGKMSDPAKGSFDCISSIEDRIKLYRETHNQEHLVDIANLCLVEFVHPSFPDVFFEAADDGIHVKKST